jgi:hypothetical protein
MDDRPGRRAITAITSVDGFSSLRFHVAYGAGQGRHHPAGEDVLQRLRPVRHQGQLRRARERGRRGVDKPDVPFPQDVVNSPAPPRADGHREWRAVPVVVAVGPGERQTLVVDGGATTRSPRGFTEESLTAFKAAGGKSGTERHHAVAPPVAGTAGSGHRAVPAAPAP